MNFQSWIKGVTWYDLQFEIKIHKLSTWTFLTNKSIKCIKKYKCILIKNHSKFKKKKPQNAKHIMGSLKWRNQVT